ncbi:MAG: right-handed parallel beta-helix repeat-containing protein, partial [Clostridia bacterium]|nr:right-handed parallel beta-helix repeat-containing protein [Clostridia bacterium]
EGMGQEDNTYWVEHNGQTVHFRLAGDADPREHRIELTVREQCFAPEEPFLSYIRVKGLRCEHAATGAPVPQRGAISAFRGHHWVIEDCEVRWSNGVAIDVGNECWHHEHTPGEIIGYSVIRGCRIRDAGVCGIAGLFAKGMLIEDNEISGTGWQKMELSWEAGAIKLHNSENALIRRNVFRDTLRADHLWLDCGNENNRITCNLFLNGIEQREAIFIECTREGVNLIDNNIIWNVEGRFDPARIPAEPGSSGWYKLRETEAVNGYAVYAEGTDRLYIAHNLIGKCRYGGYYAKPVGFRMSAFDRGGTSRKASVINNIFYDCGEAAICFPTEDNRAEGNLYIRMKGGYLRVMYPEPETCLNLPAWQEFYGFDREGQFAWLDLEPEGDFGKVRFAEAKMPSVIPDMLKHLKMITAPDGIRPVAADPMVDCDRTGAAHPEGSVLPGPFNALA